MSKKRFTQLDTEKTRSLDPITWKNLRVWLTICVEKVVWTERPNLIR